jgi:[acyl-carrier-protein] S-malonyltransferase
VLNNIDVALSNEPDVIRDALYRQAFGPVRWVELIQAMRPRGVTHAIECGPGKVLSGAIRRIDPDLPVANVQDPSSLAAARESLG